MNIIIEQSPFHEYILCFIVKKIIQDIQAVCTYFQRISI